MRAAYRVELAAITDGLEQMAHLAASAIGRATTALLDADLQLAKAVIASDDRIDRMQRDRRNVRSPSWRASSPSPPSCAPW